ncbi:MAG: hypothetical protein GC191_05980 [Azospirillum sp.]|nr:hypothetical protein [Azospirillum sp.]
MRKLLIVALIALIPLTAAAQQRLAQPAQLPLESSHFLGMTPDQALAVAIGILGGAVGLHALLGGSAATLVGAVAGAMIGNWWYERQSDGPPRRGQYSSASFPGNDGSGR